jgi:predicted transporter
MIAALREAMTATLSLGTVLCWAILGLFLINAGLALRRAWIEKGKVSRWKTN